MPDIGGAIKDIVGLGLAEARGLAEGLGLAQPQQKPGMFGAPAQYKPEDLSDLNPLQQLAVRFQNANAGAEGQPMVSHQMQERRRAANKQRTDAFGQGVKLLEDFDAIRDRASPADYDRIDGLLKKRFAELAGGGEGEADDFYDTFMSGKAGHTAAMLELARTDPAAMQIIAGGGSMADLRKYMTSPEKIKEAIERADQKLLPGARNKIDAIRYGKLPPELRADIERRMKDAGGRLTLGIIGDIEDQLPESMRFTASERESLRRNEDDLADAGLQATPEILERRKAGIDSAKQREIDAARLATEHTNRTAQAEQKHGYDMELQELRNKGRVDAAKNRKPANAGRILQHQWNAANYGKRMDQANSIMDTEQYNRAALASAVQRSLPNFMRSGDFQVQEQAELNFLRAILRKESGATITATELEDGETQFFPRAGDTPQVREQKRANRIQALEALKAEAGDAWDSIPSVMPRELGPDGKPAAQPQDAGGNVQTTPGATAAPGDAGAVRTPDQILADQRAGRITREQARAEMIAWKKAHGAALQAESAGGQ